MIPEFFGSKRPHNGFKFEDFYSKSKDYVENADTDGMDDEEKNRMDTRKLNLQRTKRILKTYEVNTELKELITAIDSGQIWMVLTEDWCGDSAQVLPIIYKLSELNKKIDLRILERDRNTDIMDNYLTNGNRGIPKLVVFDLEGNELFNWGPRPEAAKKIVRDAKKTGIEKSEWQKTLHTWYAQDKGREVEKEFIEILSSVTA